MYKRQRCEQFFSSQSKQVIVGKTIEEYVIDEVKRRRTELGISQAALADYINVSRGFIGAVENPKQRAKYNLQLINEIAKVLKCSPRDLLPPEPLE